MFHKRVWRSWSELDQDYQRINKIYLKIVKRICTLHFDKQYMNISVNIEFILLDPS